MTPEEARIKANDLADQIEQGALGAALGRAAMNARALIQGRIINTGINAEGENFPPYSTKSMYAWCGNMTVSACAKAQVRYKRKRPKGSTEPLRSFLLKNGYEEYRELHGRQTEFVDFMFKGDMWADITLTTSESEHKKGKATVTAKSPDQYKKLEGNVARKGQILDLNDEEIKTITEIIDEELEMLITKIGLR